MNLAIRDLTNLRLLFLFVDARGSFNDAHDRDSNKLEPIERIMTVSMPRRIFHGTSCQIRQISLISFVL